ncbi:sulfotransferase family protein [Rubrivirga sp. IMCC43871]|uniref:sulfotransferase family protein n=1 Tax=Rubrivirga sp. IMCC43871 TaxID=3391575 RepID=UPI00398FEEB0
MTPSTVPSPMAPPALAGALPTFIVIGGMKCGTTSLYNYLRLHPEIGMPSQKELAFYAKEWNWDRGVDWYRRQFDAATRIRGEASPQYTCYPRYDAVPERMHALVPEAKLIYLVRDPIDRLVSQYCHSLANGSETRAFTDAVLDPAKSYLRQSRYWYQIERYLAYYDRDAILVVEQDDLRTHRRETLRRVFAFVGADPEVWDARFGFEWHRTSRKRRRTALGHRIAASWPMQQVNRLPAPYRWFIRDAVLYPVSRAFSKPEVSPDLRARLVEELADDAALFREFTGQDFAHWSF